MDPTIVPLGPEHGAERTAIIDVLGHFSEQRGYPYRPESYCFALIKNTSVLGGLIAEHNWDWIYIQIIAISVELRGQGYGSKLINEIEDVARKRSCTGLWVDTFSFQSPDFYRKNGFDEFARLPGYPDDQERIFFKKLIRKKSI